MDRPYAIWPVLFIMEPLTSESLHGNWCTLLLATGSDGRIDWSAMSDEIDVLVSVRPDGIYSNGTAGEFYSQDREEFIKVSEMLASKCEKAGVNYQIGVSHPSAQESLARLHDVVQLHPGAVQIILPDWFPVSDREAVSFVARMEQEAAGVPLVLYNPPHAKRVLAPSGWKMLKDAVPSLIGVKVFDNNCSQQWYSEMNANKDGISVFVPGHHLATGVLNGADGAYSNVACINPFMAQKWSDMMSSDMAAALEIEDRIRAFMHECIDPFIVRDKYPNHACDRFMANVGAWANLGSRMRWPYDSIPEEYIAPVRARGKALIPEFFDIF